MRSKDSGKMVCGAGRLVAKRLAGVVACIVVLAPVRAAEASSTRPGLSLPVEWQEVNSDEWLQIQQACKHHTDAWREAKSGNGLRQMRPELVTLRPGMSPIKHQGKRGTCTVFAATGLLEYAFQGLFSEQCLAITTSTDGGFIVDRIESARDHGIWHEASCPYDPIERSSGIDVRPRGPDLRLDFTVIKHHCDGRNKRDPIDFIEHSIDAGRPVGVSLFIFGQWWEDGASMPRRIPVGPARAIRLGSAFPGDDLILQDALRDERDFLPYDLAAIPLMAKFFEEHSGGAGPWWQFGPVTPAASGTPPYNPYFSDFLKGMMPIDMPSEDEIERSCRPAFSGDKYECPRHAIVVTGYDRRAQLVEIRNSWGVKWKHEGYAYLPYAYIRAYHLNDTPRAPIIAITAPRSMVR